MMNFQYTDSHNAFRIIRFGLVFGALILNVLLIYYKFGSITWHQVSL